MPIQMDEKKKKQKMCAAKTIRGDPCRQKASIGKYCLNHWSLFSGRTKKALKLKKEREKEKLDIDNWRTII